MSESYFRHALPVGEVIGDYQVLSVLGAGGFGVTYLVQHRTMGDRFAIKEYFPQSLAERESSGTVVIRTHTFEDSYYKGLHGFLEEARIVRRLRGHPNVVHVNSFFEANNSAYMVMEYYAGQTLTAFRKQSGDAFDEAAIRRLMIPVLDALEYIHQRDVVHRDLKPDNVFLCEDGRPILLDFGASRFAAAGGTVPMTAVLTPGFAPPEQYISEDSGETILRQGPWTDLYALGAMLHMLASGRAPYDAMSRQMSGANDPQPPARTRLPGYSEAFCRSVDACLQLDMKQRPQSVAELRLLWNDSAVLPVHAPAIAATAPAPQAAISTAVLAPASAIEPVPAARGPVAAPLPAPPVLRQTSAGGGGSRWIAGTVVGVVLLGAGLGTWWYLRSDPALAPMKPAGVAVSAPAPAPAPVPAAMGTLMVFSDTACELKVNGEAQGVLEPGQAKSINVRPGEHAVECIVDADLSMPNRQTKLVAAGEQAVVEIVLLASNDDDPVLLDSSDDDAAIDPLAELVVTRMPKPVFHPPLSAGPRTPAGPVGAQLSSGPVDSGDGESWFASNGLSLSYAPGPTSMSRAPSWAGDFTIPDFVPADFAGNKLLKVIDSDEVILSLYGQDFSSARILLAQDASDGSELYALDFTAFAAAPQRIEADRDYVDQQIVWAQQLDDVLYVAHGHSTYARSSYGFNAYITAFDLTAGFETLWRSPAQVSNAGNFVIHDESIISGYGFTDEPDFIYVLNRSDGVVLNRIKIKSGPGVLIIKDAQLFVQAYDTGYVFELK